LELGGRTGLVFDGGGSTFRSFNAPDDQRAIWRLDASTGLALRDMTITGSYANGGTLDESLQHAHGIDMRGTSADIGPNVTLSALAGDCVYFGLGYDGSTWSSGGFHDSSCTGTSRNGVSVVAGRDITVQHVSVDRLGLHAFDVEPNVGTNGGAQRVSFDSNRIGSYRAGSYAYAIVEDTAAITVQSFTNNTVTGQLRVGVVNPSNLSFRPQNVTVSGNRSTNEGSMDIRNVDGLTVTNNTVAPASISIVNCTFVVNSGNT
jgi:hypothetical protein